MPTIPSRGDLRGRQGAAGAPAGSLKPSSTATLVGSPATWIIGPDCIEDL
jgi:hypothetical protein